MQAGPVRGYLCLNPIRPNPSSGESIQYFTIGCEWFDFDLYNFKVVKRRQVTHVHGSLDPPIREDDLPNLSNNSPTDKYKRRGRGNMFIVIASPRNWSCTCPRILVPSRQDHGSSRFGSCLWEFVKLSRFRSHLSTPQILIFRCC